MENEENKELELEAPKPLRPKKRVRSTGFDVEEPKKPEVVSEPEPTLTPEPEPEPEPTPEPTPAPAPAPAPTPEPTPAPVAPEPTPQQRTRRKAVRPMRGKPEGQSTRIRRR